MPLGRFQSTTTCVRGQGEDRLLHVTACDNYSPTMCDLHVLSYKGWLSRVAGTFVCGCLPLSCCAVLCVNRWCTLATLLSTPCLSR